MAMNTPHPDEGPDDETLELLACGRGLADVWEHAARPGTDPHIATCTYCRRAVEDLEHLRAAVLPPVTPTADIDTAAVVRRVMDAVRLELRPGRNLPLGEVDEDSWIYESVAARILRTAAQTVPGVLAGSCRITPPGSRTHPTRGPSTVHLAISVVYGQDVPGTIRAVRENLVRAARQRLGLALGDLDVTVTDLHDAPTPPREARP
ncbi:Asp23/Gls24 family envelope stress response protein [Streptomyces sp. NPDC089919]|uniref:Asp23/Gls24 family envelope stress response protein n=1 Tax=Streptomyces sp. NPDC089919 TaxID=3155188 RepID=UPI0034450392